MWYLIRSNHVKRCQEHLVFPGGHPSKYWLGSTLLHFLSLVHHLINWAMSFSRKDLGKWVIFKWISGKAKGQKGWVFSLTRSKGRKKWKKASYSPHSVFFSWLKDFPANLSFTRPFCSLADMKRPTQRSRLRLDHFVGLFMCLRPQKGLVNDNYAGKTFRHSNKTEWGK